MANKQNALFERRQKRTRYKLKKNNHGRVRLTVFRSQRHIYAQIVDDTKGVTLASASSLDAETKAALAKKDSGADVASAAAVGKAIAQRAVKKGIKEVVFDRGGYIFHGRVKALADAAREGGLSF